MHAFAGNTHYSCNCMHTHVHTCTSLHGCDTRVLVKLQLGATVQKNCTRSNYSCSIRIINIVILHEKELKILLQIHVRIHVHVHANAHLHFPCEPGLSKCSAVGDVGKTSVSGDSSVGSDNTSGLDGGSSISLELGKSSVGRTYM